MSIAEEKDLWQRLHEETVASWMHRQPMQIVDEQDLVLCLSVGPKNREVEDPPRSQPASCPIFLRPERMQP